MKEDLIETARVKAIQEQLVGFLLDEVINPKGEFYADQRTSIAQIEGPEGRQAESADDDE